jgi:hypothetical protein
MGTRGLFGLIIQGRKYATYNHFDSYPKGLGAMIVVFILSLSPSDIAAMAQRVRDIIVSFNYHTMTPSNSRQWVDPGSKPSTELQERYSALGYAELTVSEGTTEDWYCLLYTTRGAKALPAIQSGDLKHMTDSSGFCNTCLIISTH